MPDAVFAVVEAADVFASTGGLAARVDITEAADSIAVATLSIAPHTEPGDLLAFTATLRLFSTLAVTEAPDRVSIPMAPGWPSMLPIPTLQGYSFGPASAVDRRPMETGAPRVYRRTKKPPIEVAVAWQLDEDQQELLDGFQTSTLQQGAQWFGIELAFPSGFSLAVARFKGEVAMKAIGGPRWQTTATLELLTRPTMSDADLTALLDDEGDPPAWPEDLLPYPVLDTWALTPKPATIRTDDGLPGLPQARQRSRNSTTEVPAEWELSATEAAILDGFFRHRGKDGAQWFSFPIVQAIGAVDTMVRFLGEADWTPRSGGGRWAVSASLEIRERSVLTAAEVTEQIADWPVDA